MRLDNYHQKMRELFVAELRRLIAGETPDPEPIDKLLNACPQNVECCDQCADIFCPYGEPLHFHHDGCPCCSTEPIAYDDGVRRVQRHKRYERLLKRNTAETA